MDEKFLEKCTHHRFRLNFNVEKRVIITGSYQIVNRQITRKVVFTESGDDYTFRSLGVIGLLKSKRA